MATLVVLYGHPTDPAAFEDYWANRHVPYATEHMPNVTGADNLRIESAADGSPSVYYRVSLMTYEDEQKLHEAVGSDGGRAVIADLDNFATGGATVLLAKD